MNRIDMAMQAWGQKEKRVKNALSNPGMGMGDRAFHKLKLREMREIQRKFRRTANRGEKRSLKGARDSARELERYLYPNPVERYARRLARLTVRSLGSARRSILARRKTRNRQLEQVMNFSVLQKRTAPMANKAPTARRAQPKKITPVAGAGKSRGIKK